MYMYMPIAFNSFLSFARMIITLVDSRVYVRLMMASCWWPLNNYVYSVIDAFLQKMICSRVFIILFQETFSAL